MAKNKEYDYTFQTINTETVRSGLGHRHVQAILMFSVSTTAYLIRAGMSVAILAMVDTTRENNTSYQTYNWDKQTQDVILSSFFWGYCLMPVFAGVLGLRFGPWILLSITMVTNGLACAVIPLLVPYGGWITLCAIRTLAGVSQGLVFPSIHTLLARWAPVDERGRLFNFVFTGAPIGVLISQPLAGFLASSSGGWPSIFYSFGAWALLVGLFWSLFGSNSPADHKRISEIERNYIETSLKTSSNDSKPHSAPLKEMVKSIPLWALLITQVGWNFGYLILLLETPSYMSNVLGISIKMSGILSGIANIASVVVGLIASILNDAISSRKLYSNTALRKFWTTFVLLSLVLLSIILSFLPPDYTAIGVIILITMTGVHGAVPSAFMINHIELSPNFAGVLMGAATSLANLISIAGPIATGIILNNQEHDPTRWRIILLLTAAIYFVSNIIFFCFGTSDVQTWNEPKKYHLPVDTLDNQKNGNEFTKSHEAEEKNL